jgi:uncharacterized membrane protein
VNRIGKNSKAAKSARRILALALLGVFATAGIAAYAAAAKPDWTVAPTPSSQTATAGNATTYAIQLTRINGFTGSVTLSAGSLPPATTASFSPSTISSTTATTSNTSTLTLQTNANGGTTAPGNYTIVVVAKSGSTTKYTAVTLVVEAPNRPNFAVSATPNIVYIAQDDDQSFDITIDRSNGFNESIALSTYSLPDKVMATFTPSVIPATGTTARLDLHSDHNAQESSSSFGIVGTSTTSRTSRFAAVALNIESTKAISIQGGVPEGFRFGPGLAAPLDLAVTNPHKFAVRLADLDVTVQEATTARGCSGGTDFSVTQVPASSITQPPVWIPGGGTKTLTQLGLQPPVVSMPSRPTNQDVCKGARIYFEYSGEARK